MIEQRKIINLKGARYLGIPRDFDAKPCEMMIIAHDRLMGFASRKIAKMTEEAFNAELQAITEMLKAARKVLRIEETVEGDFGANSSR